jgi:hypothetical protein
MTYWLHQEDTRRRPLGGRAEQEIDDLDSSGGSSKETRSPTVMRRDEGRSEC